METLDISKEELPNFLPFSLIQDALEINPTQNLPCQLIKSPQIPPLESRIHGYRLKNSNEKCTRCELSLTNLFSLYNFEQEVQKEIKQVEKQNMSIFQALKQDKIFELAEDQIKNLLSSDKENIDPRKLKF
ncbi:unnamed protein product [Blepharisma stoltei]|uniref:Uncharacterized protein n=1 Tax=Blepharisma stoltei TaxID=1481888 RepID=A0AAU9JGT7_9CILI|nr:unnamed protein product [Blepharisma stoltei]